MTNKTILEIKKDRLAKLAENPKNIKCPGVCRKLRRQIRNMEKNND